MKLSQIQNKVNQLQKGFDLMNNLKGYADTHLAFKKELELIGITDVDTQDIGMALISEVGRISGLLATVDIKI